MAQFYTVLLVLAVLAVAGGAGRVVYRLFADHR
jgi:hypothetical protein